MLAMQFILKSSFIFILFSLSLIANTLILKNATEYSLTQYAEFYDDTSQTMDIKAVKNMPWTKIDKKTLSFPISSTAHWLRYNIENNTSVLKSYYLVYDISHINYLDVYILEDKKIVNSFKTGAYRKTSSRPKAYHNYLFPIELKANQTKEIYVRLQHFPSGVVADMKLINKEILRVQDYTNIFTQGLFFGIIIVMFFYNAFLYLMTRYTPYLAYVLYIGSFGLWLSFRMGYGIIFFDFENIALYKYLEITSSLLFSVFIIWFISGILDLKIKMPKIYLILKVLALVFILVCLAQIYAALFEVYIFMSFIGDIFVINFVIMMFLILGISLKLSLKGDVTASYIFVAWLLFLSSIVLMLLRMLAIIPHFDWIVYTIEGAMVLELILFSIILGNRYRLLGINLMKQTRLADMGSMIENIAHQWSQPLSAINADLLAMRIFIKEQKTDLIEGQIIKVENKTKMMSNIIKDFSEFYSPDKIKKIFSINRLVKNVCNDFKEEFEKKGINCTLLLEDELNIYGVENEYLQVILAILENAKQALQENQNQDDAISISLHKESSFSILSIRNNGPKISDENLDKIFKPYFTTKHKRGSGIGMYMSKKIITESFNGLISIHNRANAVELCIKVEHV